MSKSKKNMRRRLEESLARLAETDPDELAEQLAAEILEQRESAKERIETAKREIENGARSKKGRFRL